MKKIGKAGRRVLALLLTVALLLPGGIVASAADTTVTVSTAAGQIVVKVPTAGDKKLDVTFPQSDQYDVTYNGTDYEQVIGEDMKIYTPLVDTQVTVSFKIVDKQNAKNYSFGEALVTVPGSETPAQGDNPAPAVLPELREWKGGSGSFTVKDGGRIVIGDEALKDMAEEMAADYRDLTGKTLTVVSGSADDAQTGEFYFELTEDTSLGLKDEGYLMNIGDKVTVQAETATGAYWATRTILQSISQTGDIPRGKTRDYPLYKVRGFILDVGRKTFTLDYLKQVVKEMAWYKMNDFHVHLNDNLIDLEHYSTEEEIMNAYSGFRLESDIKKGGNGGLNQADLTSTDVFYTKDEFRSFIKDSRIVGVNIVPEIDVPAHSLALTKVRPDLRQGTEKRDNDHLALAAKYDECLDFVQSIFNEYMGTDLTDPVFDSETVVHIGADEYSADGEAYRKFADDMLKYVKSTGRTPRIWGSLTSIKGNQTVIGEGVQMNIWNFGWANMDQMYEEGFDLINCNDAHYYVVPNAGYYYDYLNRDVLYSTPINELSGEGPNKEKKNVKIPAGDKQMIGGAFAVWNDMTDFHDNGVSEYDVYDRIVYAFPLFGAKLWGKGSLTRQAADARGVELGSAPGNNFGYEVESKDESGAIVNYPMDDAKDLSANGYDLKLDGAKNAPLATIDGRKALRLKGGESYVQTPLTTAGLGNDLRVKVKRLSSTKDDQILFESSYGAVKAVQGKTGKVGLSRENFDYSFNYELPVGEWVELEFKNEFKTVSLYVDGVLVDTLGDGEKVNGRPLLATNMFPVEKIGSASSAFDGYVDDVRLGTTKGFHSTMELDRAAVLANEILVDKDNAELSRLVGQAEEVLRKYDPTSDEISSLAGQIMAEIAKADYDKADYSRVDVYLGVYNTLKGMDLTRFTDESAALLEQAAGVVRRDLPASMQDTVDGYVRLLESALDELQLKEIKNVNYVDNAKLSATADTYEAADSSPDKALDNDESTIWHTKWSENTPPHYIDIAISEPMNVNGLTYVTRQSGSTNGNAQEYEIQVKEAGKETYTSVKTGNLNGKTGTHELLFDTKQVTNVRLIYKSAAHGDGSAAEIKLHQADVDPDKEGLKAVVDVAAALQNNTANAFFSAGWDALQTEITKARSLIDTAGTKEAAQVESEKGELCVKVAALRIGGNTEALQERYDKYARRLQEKGFAEHYTVESWKSYKDAMAEVSELLQRNDVSQDEIDEAYNELEKLHEALEPANRDYQEGKDVYNDVNKEDPGHWFYGTVMEAYQQKIMTGKGDGTSFQPNALINRAEIAIVLHRLSGLEEPKGTPTEFVDTTPKRLYETARNAIAWASTAKRDGMESAIVTGFPERNAFDPDKPITRQQMAVMLYRYAQYMGYDTSLTKDPETQVDWEDFQQEGDKDQLWPGEFAEAMQWSVAKGIITGDGGRLNPNGSSNRAVAATMLVRFAERFDN